jgi:low temperature requirement protein LtrA
MALAIPEAFNDTDGAGVHGPLVFALGYMVVRIVHVWLFSMAGRDDPNLLATLVRFGLATAAGTGLILVAAFVDGPLELVLWIVGLTVDLVAVFVIDSGGWRLNAPRHFAERHQLIIIIALGESIVAIGVGAAGTALTWPVIVTAGLSLAVVTGLWWAYFDMVAAVAEGRLASLQGRERAAMARDSYSYLHFPMVAGIVFGALGLKKALSEATKSSSLVDMPALPTAGLWALYGGVAVYLLAHVAFRWRNVHSIGWQRPIAALSTLALAPLMSGAQALVQIAVVAAVLLAVVAYESLRFREFRDRIRHEQVHATG